MSSTWATSILIFASAAAAGDPSDQWLSYAMFSARDQRRITAFNASFKVPATPSQESGSSFSIWLGLQTSAGDGALIQPVLDCGTYWPTGYSMFHEIYDWNTKEDTRSQQIVHVQPGDTISASLRFRSDDNSYDMFMFSQSLQKSVTFNYKLVEQQDASESVAYFVLEHQPSSCDAFPADGMVTFSNIHLEIDGDPVAEPKWLAKQQAPACNSEAVIVDPATVVITWNSTSNFHSSLEI